MRRGFARDRPVPLTSLSALPRAARRRAAGDGPNDWFMRGSVPNFSHGLEGQGLDGGKAGRHGSWVGPRTMGGVMGGWKCSAQSIRQSSLLREKDPRTGVADHPPMHPLWVSIVFVTGCHSCRAMATVCEMLRQMRLGSGMASRNTTPPPQRRQTQNNRHRPS